MPLCIVCNSDYSESLAICPKCGFVPDASLVGAVKDEYPKHDPNLPDLKKYWCRKCKGHHGIYGGGEKEITKCNNCDSDDVHKVTPITLWRKFGYSLFTLVCLSLGIVAETLGVNTSPIQIAYVFYGMAVLCAFGFGYVYRTKSAARNEWLIWAKERGYEENAKKI